MRVIGVKGKLKLIVVATCLFFVFLAGCGKANYNKTTLEFRKNGNIALHIVDSFDESKYDFEELKALNEAEINVYNSYGKGKVTVENCSLTDSILNIDICYGDDDAYFDMNKMVLFYGKVSDAKNAGYNLIGKVTSTQGDGVMEQSAWTNLADYRVIVVSEEIEVDVPGKILYAGEGITLTGANKASVSGEGLHYLICE